MNPTSSLVIFSSLPCVGGHTTTTLKLCEILAPAFSSIAVIVKEIPGHGHSSAAEEQLHKAGIRTVRCKNPFALSSEFRRPRTFLAIGMRHLSPVLSLILRPRQSIYYHITHELNPEMRRQLNIYRYFFSKLVFLSPATFSLYGQCRRTDWAVQPTQLPAAFSPRRIPHCGVPRLGFIGRLNPAKGTNLLLDFIGKTEVACELHVAGSGECEDRVREMSQDSARPGRVIYHGSFQSDRRVDFLQTFFSQIDTLCVPSLDDREGIPNVIPESLQAGVPVFASNTGGMRSFALPELGPAPEGTVTVIEPSHILDTLNALIRRPPGDSSQRCKDYFAAYFSDAVVSRRWTNILADIN